MLAAYVLDMTIFDLTLLSLAFFYASLILSSNFFTSASTSFVDLFGGYSPRL